MHEKPFKETSNFFIKNKLWIFLRIPEIRELQRKFFGIPFNFARNFVQPDFIVYIQGDVDRKLKEVAVCKFQHLTVKESDDDVGIGSFCPFP